MLITMLQHIQALIKSARTLLINSSSRCSSPYCSTYKLSSKVLGPYLSTLPPDVNHYVAAHTSSHQKCQDLTYQLFLQMFITMLQHIQALIKSARTLLINSSSKCSSLCCSTYKLSSKALEPYLSTLPMLITMLQHIQALIKSARTLLINQHLRTLLLPPDVNHYVAAHTMLLSHTSSHQNIAAHTSSHQKCQDLTYQLFLQMLITMLQHIQALIKSARTLLINSSSRCSSLCCSTYKLSSKVLGPYLSTLPPDVNHYVAAHTSSHQKCQDLTYQLFLQMFITMLQHIQALIKSARTLLINSSSRCSSLCCSTYKLSSKVLGPYLSTLPPDVHHHVAAHTSSHQKCQDLTYQLFLQMFITILQHIQALIKSARTLLINSSSRC